jgi:hypothetical protein
MTKRKKDDCMRATLAHYFGMGYEDVPDFPIEIGSWQIHAVQNWLAWRLGLQLVKLDWEDEPTFYQFCVPIGVPLICTVSSRPGVEHIVIAELYLNRKGGICLRATWDPNGEVSGTYDFTSVGFLIPVHVKTTKKGTK